MHQINMPMLWVAYIDRDSVTLKAYKTMQRVMHTFFAQPKTASKMLVLFT